MVLEFGTDISKNWIIEDGDIRLISDEENLIQSVVNRLNCEYDFFDLYYLEYGSFLSKYMGWKRVDETLSFMKIEISNVLKQDTRIKDFTVDLKYTDNESVEIRLKLEYPEQEINTNLIYNNNEVKAEW